MAAVYHHLTPLPRHLAMTPNGSSSAGPFAAVSGPTYGQLTPTALSWFVVGRYWQLVHERPSDLAHFYHSEAHLSRSDGGLEPTQLHGNSVCSTLALGAPIASSGSLIASTANCLVLCRSGARRICVHQVDRLCPYRRSTVPHSGGWRSCYSICSWWRATFPPLLPVPHLRVCCIPLGSY